MEVTEKLIFVKSRAYMNLEKIKKSIWSIISSINFVVLRNGVYKMVGERIFEI